MQRLSVLLIPLTLALGACDTEDSVIRDADVADAPAALEQGPPDDGDETRPHGDHRAFHGPGKMINRLCSRLGCTPDQVSAIEDLARDLRPDGPPDFSGPKEARKALADAFRSDSLDTDVLETHRDAFQKRADTMKSTMADGLVGLHAILTPEQRDEMAEIIEKRGPRFLSGHHGRGHHGGKHRGHHRAKGGSDDATAHRPDPARRAQHMVDRLCEKVSCTDEQATRIAEVVSRDVSELKPGAMQDAKRDLAASFRTDDFGPEQVKAHLATAEEAMKVRFDRHKATMAAVHDILTPEQRELVAEAIEKRGPRALMGGGHRRGHHRK